MAQNSRLIRAPIGDVFDVLSNPANYDRFVAGARKVRRFDPQWPDPGSALHHAVGIGPLALPDKTTVVEVARPTSLLVRPYVRPFLISETRFDLRPEGDSTLVSVVEYPVGGLLHRIWCRPLDLMIDFRNRELLRRLAKLAEHHHETRRRIAGVGAPSANPQEPARADGDTGGDSS